MSWPRFRFQVLTTNMNTSGAVKKSAVHTNVGAVAQRDKSNLKRRGDPPGVTDRFVTASFDTERYYALRGEKLLP